MGQVKDRLALLGLQLPAGLVLPPGVVLPFRSLERELGDLDRAAAWVRVLGMVQRPVYSGTPGVVNGFSDLVLEVFGHEAGAHARSAVGVAELPFNIPFEVAAEALLRSWRSGHPAEPQDRERASRDGEQGRHQ